ncbi:hypothetical protein [Alkalihalobacterium alkalinitrilicum]|uniref:hypothetical protein n=1 Tax=Alkalihalobacterium alkalinitrilicum TaxID=427920 RepID=UPI0013036947|nr:hypothetical protein [Alkalihalobacterium alkalinitrilicum]
MGHRENIEMSKEEEEYLNEEWLELVELAELLNVSKQEFKQYLKEKSKNKVLKG